MDLTRLWQAVLAVIAFHLPDGAAHAIPPAGQPPLRVTLPRVTLPRVTRLRVTPLHLTLLPQPPLRHPRAAISDGRRVACQVTTVHDGDTFRCRGDVRVRLLLIDAPEIDQPLGPVARDALRTMVPPGATVWLEFDVQRRDRYGRTLAYVWSAERGGRLVNLDMAEAGWVAAVVFPPNGRRVDEIRAAVLRARQSKRGMWATERVCEPIDHKKGRC